MAKVQFGGGISAMSGKAAGNVFARNKGGAYMRNWVRPTNPQTTAQQNQRNTLALKSAAWRTLTDSQRDSWKSWADDNPVLDRMGASIVLTGAQAYTKININRDNASDGATQSTTPGSPTFAAQILDTTDSLDIQIAGATFLVPLGAGAAENDVVFIFASKPVSAGVTNTNSSLRLVQVTTISAGQITAGEIECISNYTSTFGALTGKEGLRVNVSGRQYDEGQLNTAQDVTGTIAA
jgi:hypothetical protein|tara:strand:- start:74 stop:784 length:711 start_codon:yes stop_codon:yes gene_type:complete